MIASPSFSGFLDRFNDASSIVILVSSFALLLGLLGAPAQRPVRDPPFP